MESLLKLIIIFTYFLNHIESNLIQTPISELDQIDEKYEKLPIYVKELYETVKSENELFIKRNHFDSNGDTPLTIQAIRQEIDDVSSNDDDGVDMKFSLKQIWLSAYSMAQAELVVGVQKSILHQSSRYILNIHVATDERRRPLIVSQLLDLNREADADFHFVVVPFTDIVKSLISDWRRSDNRTEILSFRLNVDEIRPNDVGVYKMDSDMVRSLLRAKNLEKYPPLLILYSAQIDQTPFSFYGLRRKRRLRRDNAFSSSRSIDVDVCTQNCALRSWIVDLKEYFSDDIITPRSAKINFCSGKCPFPAFDSYWNSTANAVVRKNFVMTGVNDGGGVNPPIYVPDVVCVPKSYKSLTTLSLKDNKTFVIENKMNMVATSCMCA